MRIAAAATLLLVLTCSEPAQPYNVAVKNATSARFQDAVVSFGEFRSLGGSLPPGSHTRQGPIPYPIPDRATVTWRTADGVSHSKEVAVRPTVPTDFRGSIFFDVVEGGDVRVRLVPSDP